MLAEILLIMTSTDPVSACRSMMILPDALSINFKDVTIHIFNGMPVKD
jgi:hypothetical protein